MATAVQNINFFITYEASGLYQNPAVETHNIFNATDEDIFESVMDGKKLRESAGGDDDDIDMPAPGPATRSKVLQAVLMLRKYAGTLNDLFACKLEVMLGSFGQQTHAVEMQGMKDTKLTDYFPRK